MQIIEIKSLDNGAHRNQKSNSLKTVPAGWAVVPDTLVCENFPFGEVTADDSTPPVVTEWTPLPIPEPEPVEETPSQLDVLEAQVTYTAMMTDTLLEV